MKLIKKQKNNSRGFTLLEVLVSITILVFAITATFTAAQSGLTSAYESKNQVTAFYLAQEAVEYVRNTRDSNSLFNSDPNNLNSQKSWLAGIADPANVNDPCYNGNKCVIDALGDTFNNHIINCPSGICPFLKQDTSTGSATYGMYSYRTTTGWNTSNFQREIQITIVNPQGLATPPEITMKVTVTWTQGSFSRSFTISESIFNWQS